MQIGLSDSFTYVLLTAAHRVQLTFPKRPCQTSRCGERLKKTLPLSGAVHALRTPRQLLGDTAIPALWMLFPLLRTAHSLTLKPWPSLYVSDQRYFLCQISRECPNSRSKVCHYLYAKQHIGFIYLLCSPWFFAGHPFPSLERKLFQLRESVSLLSVCSECTAQRAASSSPSTRTPFTPAPPKREWQKTPPFSFSRGFRHC